MENKKINIAELLKDCPKGMELYSPLCGKCVFDRLNFGTIICKKQNTQEITFTSQGHYMLPVFDDCECMIFPSKDQRDWSKFVPPCKFKDGDILSNGISISIHNGYEGEYHYGCYVAIGNIDLPNYFVDREDNKYVTKDDIRLATEEEKKKLFDAIKENGYRWSPETKTLEELIKPKFKVGDKIKHKDSGIYCTLREYSEDILAYRTNIGLSLTHKDLEDWELVKNKFDITTLKPFKSEVLVRDTAGSTWLPCFFGGLSDINDYPYRIVGGESWKCCIPYEGNEHLLGKKDDCSEYYKNW